MVKEPSISLAMAFNRFWEHILDERMSLSIDQQRVKRNIYLKAIRNFEEAVGAISIHELCREHAMQFRSWWVNRIEETGLKPYTAIMRTITNLGIWPHKISLRAAFMVAGLLLVLQVIGQLLAAYKDGTLILVGEDVGLLEHPGIFSIIIGDFILFLLSAFCAKEFYKLGKRVPSIESETVDRYFRISIWRRWFGGGQGFLKLFGLLFFIGMLALINQSIKLFEPERSYGHDTFDSYVHIYSYWFNRVNLFISWCITIPLFVTYLTAYTVSVNALFQTAARKKLLSFHFRHEALSGGFSFFGTLNVLYIFGLFVILMEVILLIYTHRQVALTNLLPMIALTVTFISFSYFSVFEVNKALKQLETKLKQEDFHRFKGNQMRIDAYHLVLHYNVKFSLYTSITEKTLLSMRLVAAVPTVYKLYQYSKIMI